MIHGAANKTRLSPSELGKKQGERVGSGVTRTQTVTQLEFQPRVQQRAEVLKVASSLVCGFRKCDTLNKSGASVALVLNPLRRGGR